jgi:hypothetical protein
MRTQPIKTIPEPAHDDQPALACFDLPDLGISTDAPTSVASQAISPATDVAAAAPSPRNRRGTVDYFQPRDLALRWGVCVDKVLNFIRSGELRAFNVASKTSKRPRYRISMAEVTRCRELAVSAIPAEARPGLKYTTNGGEGYVAGSLEVKTANEPAFNSFNRLIAQVPAVTVTLEYDDPKTATRRLLRAVDGKIIQHVEVT